MKLDSRHALGIGLLLALIGAILAFALNDPDEAKLGIRLEPLGGILLATGTILAAGAAIAAIGGGGGSKGLGDPTNLKSIVGLVAVVAGIVAVTALTVITVTTLSADSEESMIAVTSSAFGVISAVVSAYLGIKITAETSGKATEEVERAASAKTEAKAAQWEAAAAQERADKARREVSKVKGAAADVLRPEQEEAFNQKLSDPEDPTSGSQSDPA